jgi:hypothetical protein
MDRGPNDDPVVVVVKRHRDRAHFEHEARWLTAALHRPVARLEAVMAERLTLTTRFNPAVTLADAAMVPATASALLAELALIVADLAVDGLTHGNLDVDHVLRDRRGRVFVVSPAPTAAPGADLVGLARCCRQVMETADAVAVERGEHPWGHRERRRWHELGAVLVAGDLGPQRAARHLNELARTMAEPSHRRLRRRLRS